MSAAANGEVIIVPANWLRSGDVLLDGEHAGRSLHTVWASLDDARALLDSGARVIWSARDRVRVTRAG